MKCIEIESKIIIWVPLSIWHEFRKSLCVTLKRGKNDLAEFTAHTSHFVNGRSLPRLVEFGAWSLKATDWYRAHIRDQIPVKLQR